MNNKSNLAEIIPFARPSRKTTTAQTAPSSKHTDNICSFPTPATPTKLRNPLPRTNGTTDPLKSLDDIKLVKDYFLYMVLY